MIRLDKNGVKRRRKKVIGNIIVEAREARHPLPIFCFYNHDAILGRFVEADRDKNSVLHQLHDLNRFLFFLFGLSLHFTVTS